MKISSAFHQVGWFLPFFSLGFMALALLRPWPSFPRPPQYRLVADANGIEVAVPLPVRVIVTTGGGDFLETTHAPEALFKAGSPAERTVFTRSLLGHIYPELVRKDELWTVAKDIESILAEDDGATYISGDGNDALRRIGLPVVALVGEGRVDLVRIEAAVLGHETYGEKLLADRAQRLANIEAELRHDALTSQPRTLPMGSSPSDWSKVWAQVRDWPVSDHVAGIRNASEGFRATGRQQEAERILAMNPDIIFYSGSRVEDLLYDPRWQGLKAVKDRKVYIGAWNFRGVYQVSWGFDINPIIERWEAEIAHPERLQPKLRDVMRSHFEKAYGYRLSDDEIDDLLRLNENKEAAGYERFTKSGTSVKSELIQ